MVESDIRKYLKENGLPKIACFTNMAPSKRDRAISENYFNYVCYSVDNINQKAEFLMKIYLTGTSKVPFDVLIESCENCLLKRQFSFIAIQGAQYNRLNHVINYISQNKRKINRRYPLLVALNCTNGLLEKISIPENAIADKIRKNTLVLKVK
jgi:hypothetical protein